MPGPLKHERDLSQLRNQYGIKAADWSEALELDGRLQGVTLLDDARQLVRPLDVPYGYYEPTEGAGGAGVYSMSRIVFGGRNGAYLISLWVAHVGWVATENLGAETITGGVTVPCLLGGNQLPMTSEVRTGTLAARPVRYEIPANIDLPGLPLWFAPGRELHFGHSTANTAFTGRVIIQEVP